jgi:hypothetical protein
VKPGFREVEIAPLPGNLRSLNVRIPHPRGWIEGNLKFDADQHCTGEITLPPDTRGTFVWQGVRTELSPGKATVIGAR